MERPRFEWDEAKARSNEAKHGVTFSYATRVFADPRFWLTDATRDEDGEARWKAVGMVQGRVLTVVYTLRGDAARFISARRANPPEERSYDRQLHL